MEAPATTPTDPAPEGASPLDPGPAPGPAPSAPVPALLEPGRRRRRAATGLRAGGGGSVRSSAVGAFGERLAERHLAEGGLVVVDRNWRCELGEIDLVSIEPGPGPQGRTLAGARTVVVCEVKTRTSTRFGVPREQVTTAKAAKLRSLARRWVQEHPAASHAPVRVDVIGVLVPGAGAPVVDHVVGVG